MTIQEARIYFNSSDQEELADQYETKLFTDKNFFVSNTPITKVFLARLKKLKLIHEAYLALGGEETLTDNEDHHTELSSDLGSAFRDYNSTRSILKQKIMIVKSVPGLEKMVLNLLNATRVYANKWKFEYDDFEGVLVSNEMDLMNVLQEIKKLELLEPLTIEVIRKLDDENILVRESKRLSLWLKLDVNV